MTLRVVNWNVEWGNPKWVRPIILQRIFEREPEVICLTETDDGFLAKCGGYTISPECDFGQGAFGSKRKVLLWSRKPWKEIVKRCEADVAPGRFVSGITETSIGAVTFIGVCIPYHNSRIDFGKKPWQDHEEYLNGLANILQNTGDKPLIVLGDFNHQIGQGSYPYPPANHPVRKQLVSAMEAGGLTVATAALGFQGKRSIRRTIDHIAVSDDLSAESLGVISNRKNKPQDLSDHFGVFADLATRNLPTEPV